MKFGLFGINLGACAEPDVSGRVARAAEAAGFDSVWTGEHVVLPDPQAPPSPAPPQTPFLDPAVALANLAPQTERLRLATGIIILPQRNPLVLAKELASVDVVSKGRLVFGIGVGYLKAEFDALGVPFERKGRRTEEYLEAIQAVWTQKNPSYRGEFVSFGGIDAQPRPVQQPHPPVVFGGFTAPAFRRSVERANGWYGFHLDLERTRECLEGIAEAKKRYERPAALGELEITVTPPPGVDADAVRRYADLGVDRIVLLGLGSNEGEILRLVETAGTELMNAV